MKGIVLSGIALIGICATAAFAQSSAGSLTPSTPGQSSGASQTITMSGCVGGGSNAQPFVLSNPIVLPSDSGATTQPPASATPSASTPPTSTPQGTAGTSGTSTSSPTGALGTSYAAGTSATAGTSGVPGTNATSSALNGYRLTGTDMVQWSGRRVEITGTFVPASSQTAITGAAPSTMMQEFRVVSVKPTTGSCPQ